MTIKIKWGPGEDQNLLLKILEVHPNFKLDANKVAEAWSSKPELCPTPRAITERLVTIRKRAKVNGSTSQFAIGSAMPARAQHGMSTSKKEKHETKAEDGGFIDDSDEDMLGVTYQTVKSKSELNGPTSHSLALTKTPIKAKMFDRLGLPTPSRTASTATSFKSRKHPLGSLSDEDELTIGAESDDDDLPDLKTMLNTPTKMRPREKRAIKRPKYTLDEDDEAAGMGSDESDFDPLAERREEERKACRRQGILSSGYSSDQV